MNQSQRESYDVGVHHTDRGPSNQAFGGTYFYILDPRPEDIHLVDIARHLSKLCRFTGGVSEFYSVAQHSVMVSKLVPPEHAKWGLFHDAAEAYIGDISRPLKIALESVAPGVIRAIDDKITAAIAERFNLGPEPHAIVKHADNVALATEKRDLKHVGTPWPNMPKPTDERIVPLDHERAFHQFMVRYTEVA